MMIRLVSGTVASVAGNTLVVMTTGGIGYFIHVPARSSLLPGDTTTLHTHLAVRETALDLYGFIEESDLTLFELLLTINGVGPKSALQIMDQAERTVLIEGIRLEDAGYLTKFSGVTKKTAEKIILTLKGKVDHLTPTTATTPASGTAYQDAFDTLITLGYSPLQVRQTLDTLPPHATTSQLVAEALRLL